jgi:hypothetical protein
MAGQWVSIYWLVAGQSMHRIARDVRESQKYEKSLLHFLLVPLDFYANPVGSLQVVVPYDTATIVIKIFIHTNHTSTNVFIKKEIILF